MCLAIPGELVELTEKEGLRFGRVRFGGISREVCLEYQPDAKPGDFVLVHVGFAISTLDREEAARTLEVLRQIGQTAELDEEESAVLGIPFDDPLSPTGTEGGKP